MPQEPNGSADDKSAADLTPPNRMSRSTLLKACIFATGLAGIVSEYVMSTLATYLLGDAVLQWTLTISLMLFAMGVGSRLSRFISCALIDSFVAAELALSVLCASSATLIYLLSTWITTIAPLIYLLSFSIGLLIGIEIPLVTRLNNVFEELRFNISSVMEKDYLGALVGGLLFAFVAMPFLGLIYTPIALGTINFMVAALLFIRLRHAFVWRRQLGVGFLVVSVFLVSIAFMAEPIVLYGEQHKYRDLVIHQQQTPYQRIVITRWKNHHWLYLDGSEQFSSYDEHRYHEPLVHPAMLASARRSKILILGGGDGLAAREVLKHSEVDSVQLVDIDRAMTDLGRSHPVLLELNRGALDDERVEVVNLDAYTFLLATEDIFDVRLIDFPDPNSVAAARLY